ncbi:MAG TPA: CARDB domain-containing protein [Gaiellaceae bacterium]
MGSKWGVTAFVALAAVPGIAGAALTKAPPLKISGQPLSATVVQGSTIDVKLTVRNRGKAKSKKTTVALYLSADRKKDSRDAALTPAVQVPALGPKKAKALTVTLTVRESVAAGSYFVLACPSRTGCVTLAGKLTVQPKGATVPPPGYFPRPANPLNVSIDVDGAQAVISTIGSGGGEITATAANGTRFTLVVPKDALLDDERITLTPVRSIGNLPFSGGLVGAVEITPHGLQLLRPATLSIQPAGSVSAAGRSAFLAHQAGSDFQLQPLRSGSDIVISLTHFSTPGVGVASSADVANVLSHMPARTLAQYQTLISEQVKKLGGSEAEAARNDIAALAAAYYRDIVKPLVDKAVSDDSYAVEAVHELISWARQLELLGLEDHPLVKTLHDGVWEKVAIILRNAINKAYARCANHDLSEVVRLISYERQMQLLGLDEGDALGKAERCARFELDFDSAVSGSLHVEGPTGAGLSCCPRAEVELQAQDVEVTLASDFRFRAKKQRSVVRRQVFDWYECYTPSEGLVEHIDLEVRDLGFNYNITERRLPDGRIVRDVSQPAVAMLLYPGVTAFHWDFSPLTGEPCFVQSMQAGAMYDFVVWELGAGRYYGQEIGAPQGAHAGEFAGMADGLPEPVNLLFRLADWGAPSGALVGRKTYQFSGELEVNNGTRTVSEATTLTLFHRPG